MPSSVAPLVPGATDGGATGGADGPSIAVIIGSVARERFLRAAVESVVDQTLPRPQYEIVVTRDVRTSPDDDYLHAQGVRVIWDPDVRPGRVVRAARSTRAPLIAYLDDDDQFEPERLAHVVERFRAHPEIGFYRNRVSVIDEDGRALPPERWDRLYATSDLDRTGAVLIEANRKRERWPELPATFPDFNLSSMVVRREVFDDGRGELLEGMGARIDLGQFAMSYLGPGALYLDDQRLTRYRLHTWNNSRLRVRPGQLTPKGWDDLDRLARAASERGAPELARWIRWHRITAGLGFHVDRLTRAAQTPTGGSTAPAYARQYLRFLIDHPQALAHAWAWRPLAYAAIQVAVPPLSHAPGAERALRREVLQNYSTEPWTEVEPPSRGA